MNGLKQVWKCILLCGLASMLMPFGFAQQSQPVAAARDGQHDFDFDVGTWKLHVSRLQHPLTGSKTWLESDGTVVVRKVWNGRANLAEITTDGQGGHLEFLALRLYNPESHQWSLNFAS